MGSNVLNKYANWRRWCSNMELINLVNKKLENWVIISANVVKQFSVSDRDAGMLLVTFTRFQARMPHDTSLGTTKASACLKKTTGMHKINACRNFVKREMGRAAETVSVTETGSDRDKGTFSYVNAFVGACVRHFVPTVHAAHTLPHLLRARKCNHFLWFLAMFWILVAKLCTHPHCFQRPCWIQE